MENFMPDEKLDKNSNPVQATIMIVDDEDRIRRILAIQLQKAGYNVLSLGDGQEAMELLSKVNVDVVISDIRMPGITGDQILRYIKTHNPSIPVIMLTGVVDVETAVSIMRS
ncbi:hypothetical protein DRQ26_01550 [bacterium]|nr:MAG: hypothetical protein DRQ26_01550 [bacterium]